MFRIKKIKGSSLFGDRITLPKPNTCTSSLLVRFRATEITVLHTGRYASSSTKQPVIIPSKQVVKEQTEYRQLPDDSQYIEKFYNELKAFQLEISTNDQITFNTFSEFEQAPNQLVTELEIFVQNKVLSKYAGKSNIGSRVVVERYLQFLENVKLTLLLNGGHPFIFDVLLQSKALFDGFDRGK